MCLRQHFLDGLTLMLGIVSLQLFPATIIYTHILPKIKHHFFSPSSFIVRWVSMHSLKPPSWPSTKRPKSSLYSASASENGAEPGFPVSEPIILFCLKAKISFKRANFQRDMCRIWRCMTRSFCTSLWKWAVSKSMVMKRPVMSSFRVRKLPTNGRH